jgi:hypothetical protein
LLSARLSRSLEASSSVAGRRYSKAYMVRSAR